MPFSHFCSGHWINRYYFPVYIPIGIIGNVLSFLVSIYVDLCFENVNVFVQKMKKDKIPNPGKVLE